MPEVFQNFHAFPPGSVPTAEAFRDQLNTQFNVSMELEKQEQGFKGAPRAYACLKTDQNQIWIYWQPDRPEVELSVDEPMERMLQANAAITALGGNPRYPDASWKARRRFRTQHTIARILVILFLISLAITTIHYLHWWGLLIVIATIVTAVVLYTIGLARSFANG
jgi:hypothetical protein